MTSVKNDPALIASAGLHHFRLDDGSRRVHLRVEEDGSGILTIDASRMIFLNAVGCDMAWMILSGIPRKEMVGRLMERYRVRRRRAEKDLSDFSPALSGFLRSGGTEPISYSNIAMKDFYGRKVSAPYRMDLALTYRCNLACGHCYNESRQMEEMPADRWKEILRRIRDIGIPHVIFTGGEVTLRPDLPELIGFAESLGLVTGLLTNGVHLADRDYVKELCLEGLDHVQITLESSDSEIHGRMTGSDSFPKTVKGIENCLESQLYTITNTTVTRHNWMSIADTLEFVRGMGLESAALNAVICSGRAKDGDDALPPGQLEGVLIDASSRADELGLRLVWYSPTRYCRLNPLELGLGPRRCTAGEYNLCIEPDGSVLPCQSWYQSAGNILHDSWDKIWNSRLLLSARNREWADEECSGCIHFHVCGGGCPLESRTATACRDSM